VPQLPHVELQAIGAPRGARAPQGGDQGGRGSGLGLTIVSGMVGAHGGKVEAAPGPGCTGTTIRVTLPVPESPGGDGDGGDEAE